MTAVLLAAATTTAQTPLVPAGGSWSDPEKAVRVTVGEGVPLAVTGRDFAGTEIYSRGPFIVIDLDCTLTLRNDSTQRLRAATFSVLAQRNTAGGRASVVLPSLNVGPGETFPAKIRMRLLRPLPGPVGVLTQIRVDGVLTADLSFVGPDTLKLRRKITLLELEARRERERLLRVLDSDGEQALSREMLTSLERQARRPKLRARLAGGTGRAVSPSAGAGEERSVTLAFLDLPDAPLALLEGSAAVSGATAFSPLFTVRNRSSKAIERFEVGWIIRDLEGTSFGAGSAPAAPPAAPLAPGASIQAGQPRRYEFSLLGRERFSIGGMGGYVRRVEFADGSYWIPSREELAAASLLEVEPVSTEGQRLADVYRIKGVDALRAELESYRSDFSSSSSAK